MTFWWVYHHAWSQCGWLLFCSFYPNDLYEFTLLGVIPELSIIFFGTLLHNVSKVMQGGHLYLQAAPLLALV